tara:strand:- start:93 stop:443 length:351 start_codon:yes stop_codon:yes gene_type:complete
MFPWLNHSKFIYIISNLLVLPAILIPSIDLISNISFIVAFLFFLNFNISNMFFLLALSAVFVFKNNANYRFNLLLNQKGEEQSKSDYECVYLFAWCTLLRYSLIGLAVNRIFLFLK